MQTQVQSLDSILEEFDSEAAGRAPEPVKPLGFHIPVPQKEKYDALQRQSGQKFGKTLTKLIMTAIDRAKLDY
jgi:hypothetical protein